MIVADNLWKTYGTHPVVQGVSFSLNSGEILGLVGPNGAGKTTIVGMLYGAVIPSQGFVQLDSYQISSEGRQARYSIGIVTQADNLDEDFTVVENLISFARYYHLTGKVARNRAEELLAKVGLQASAHCQINQLSGGMKRRLVLARALLNHPKVLFLDEPTTGLDPDARQNFWQLVTQLKHSGCGILLTTHYMDEAQRLCDRLLLLQQGKVIDRGTPAELIERIVGQEVVEIVGIAPEILQQLTIQAHTWFRPFGSSYLVTLPPDNPQILWEQLVNTQPVSLSRRRANLEDVFLQLTGTRLK